MTAKMRRKLVAYLANRGGIPTPVGRLALATDAELRRLASVRLVDVDADVSELELFGFWPMPPWMVSGGVEHHGWDHMRRYF